MRGVVELSLQVFKFELGPRLARRQALHALHEAGAGATTRKLLEEGASILPSLEKKPSASTNGEGVLRVDICYSPP